MYFHLESCEVVLHVLEVLAAQGQLVVHVEQHFGDNSPHFVLQVEVASVLLWEEWERIGLVNASHALCRREWIGGDVTYRCYLRPAAWST